MCQYITGQDASTSTSHQLFQAQCWQRLRLLRPSPFPMRTSAMPDARAARSPRMTSCPETRPNRRWAALIWGPHSALPGANTPPFSFPPPTYAHPTHTHTHIGTQPWPCRIERFPRAGQRRVQMHPGSPWRRPGLSVTTLSRGGCVDARVSVTVCNVRVCAGGGGWGVLGLRVGVGGYACVV